MNNYKKNYKIKLLFVFGLMFILASCNKHSKLSNEAKENVLRFSLDEKVTSLDPQLTNDVYSSIAEALVYESLYEFHYLKKPSELVPLLAEKLPEISKDKKHFKIQLKKSIFFHDDPCFEGGRGRELVANDVLETLKKMAAPKSLSPYYVDLEDKIKGIRDYHLGKSNEIAGVTVKDKYNLEIELLKPSPRFIYNFANVHFAVLPIECVKKYGDEFAKHPVGTGPYRYTQADFNHKFVAVKNPNYSSQVYPTDASDEFKKLGLLEDAGKKLPFIDKIIFEIIIETQPKWLKFLAGDIDFLAVPKDNLSSVLVNNQLAPELASRGVTLHQGVKADLTVQIFNMEDPVWGKSKALRQALALALDVNKIIEIQYGGQAVRAHSFVDPLAYGYNPSFKSQWATRDIAKAKKLLAEAGYPNGQGLAPVVYLTNTGTIARNFMDLLSRQLDEVGIKLQPEFLTWPQFEKRLREKNFTLTGMGYAAGVPDVDDETGILHSKNAAPGNNLASYRNPQADHLIDEIEILENSKLRLEKVAQLVKIIDNDLPIIPMVHRIGNQVVQPWVKNHVFVDTLQFASSLKFHKVAVKK